MRAIKGFILFCFLGIMVSACFDAPEFGIKPQITFKSIQFKETPSLSDYDTLVLLINFKDGDGDLGLSADNPIDASFPYHDAYYYLATGAQLEDTVRVSTAIGKSDNEEFIILESADENLKGILVTNRMRSVPGFEDLPLYDPSKECLNYSVTQVLVPERFDAVDGTFNILDTLYSQQNGDRYFLVEEALLFKRNINHHNIDINFFYLNTNGDYVKYDWFKNFCFDYNGRFPILGNGNRPLEGTIRYVMPNSSFKAIFGGKQLRLSIKIRDRALHQSDSIVTPSFDLLN